jgi:hypothetical protein
VIRVTGISGLLSLSCTPNFNQRFGLFSQLLLNVELGGVHIIYFLIPIQPKRKPTFDKMANPNGPMISISVIQLISAMVGKYKEKEK